MKNEFDLKPCPFCGGEASISETFTVYDGSHKTPSTYYGSCMLCGCNMKGVGGGLETKEQAAEYWNNRTDA